MSRFCSDFDNRRSGAVPCRYATAGVGPTCEQVGARHAADQYFVSTAHGDQNVVAFMLKFERRGNRSNKPIKHTKYLPKSGGCDRSPQSSTNLCSHLVGFKQSTYVKKTFLAALS